MTSPQKPPTPSKTLLGTITNLVQTVHARIDFSKLAVDPKARVPKLRVHNLETDEVNIYPLIGDRYILGRSSKGCDIVVRNPVVSQTHLTLSRDSRRPHAAFVAKDERSTNGTYIGRRRIERATLYHGDRFTLGPPELASAVQVDFQNPPPWYITALRYGIYGMTGVSALVALWIGLEWQKFNVRPFPGSVDGPVIVYSQDGRTPLRQPRSQAHRELRRLSDYSPHLPNAVMASEDSRFYWHLGVDPIGTIRALWVNVSGGELREGGSSITQQLARSVFRSYVGTDDSLGRKIREAVVSLKLELVYSKDDLMLMYLNRVYLGSGLSGFEDASQFYFAKPAQELTISEAATLVGILPAPNSFNPVQSYDTAVELRNRVINRMAALGMITSEEAQRARRSRIELNPAAVEELQSTLAPYFYGQVFFELEDLLGADLAREGNFVIESTVDLATQAQAESSLQQAIASDGVTYGYTQGAIVTLDSATGEILALVGGTDYQASQFNRATQALRQPGSTFKVFAYAAALELGISPGTSYSCAPLTWQGQSFDGCRSGGGSMDMYTGMALSENVVALRIAQEAGLDRVVRNAQRLGIESDLNPVPGLILGQSEVTLVELTGAFGVFANEGVRNPPHTIRRILDSSDCEDNADLQTCRVIFDYRQDAQANIPVLDPAIATTMTGMLQSVVQSGTGRAAYLGVGEAGKTGTTNDNVDLWFVGYIPRQNLVSGIWLGNDDNAATFGSSSQAAQVWGDYMERVLR
ncbi:MAG TPA: transglycosylase domain-containing protein [Candidatus Obscuribacterales bacterium]